ncbi:MAG: N-acetylglucosamine-6-phosphate deacetylase [Pyrinomonadaceae bacterium]
MKSLLLRNANVVFPEEKVKHVSVLIEEGKIAKLAPDTEPPRGAEEIDLSNMTLMPGFIDVHIHGAAGWDVMDASAAELQKVSEFLATQGVTGWLPTIVPAAPRNYSKVIKAISATMKSQGDSESQEGARILGVHYEGPFVNSAQCGALHSEHFKTYARPYDLEILKTPADQSAVKMITVAPEIDGGVPMIIELRRQGWVVSIGHTRADVEALDLAFSAGARHMTHFMNAMSPLHHRAPGPVGWGLSRDDVTCDVIADGIHLDPRIFRLLLKMKTPQKLALISDAIAAAGMGDGDYNIWGETITVENGRTRNARGNIAGSVITMLDAVRATRTLGVAQHDVARMASTNPAELLKLDSECGSIQEGKRADLVALDEQGRVHLTVVGGVVSFSSFGKGSV